MNKLEETGLIITFVRQDVFRKVKHYTINYTVLHQLQGISHMHPTTVDVSKEEEEAGTEEEESIQEMLLVWNDTVQSRCLSGQPVILTPKRLLGLTNLRDAFAKQGLSWRNYCNKIAGTRFLMGENTNGFKATLDWALNLGKACKVLDGAIYDKPPSTMTTSVSTHDDWTILAEEIKTFLPINAYASEWLAICQHLVKNIGVSAFRSWFLKQVRLISINNNTATLQFDTNFHKDWLCNHYRAQIVAALCSVCPTITDVEFQV